MSNPMSSAPLPEDNKLPKKMQPPKLNKILSDLREKEKLLGTSQESKLMDSMAPEIKAMEGKAKLKGRTSDEIMQMTRGWENESTR